MILSGIMLYGITGYAQTAITNGNSNFVAADSARIFYKKGYRYVDTTLRDNGTELRHFLQAVKNEKNSNRQVRILINSGASPDGSAQANEKLSHNRANELSSYIAGNIDSAGDHKIEKRADGILWKELSKMVEASDMPYREDVQSILDKPCSGSESANAIRKESLLELHSGKPYNYMLENMFPDLRCSYLVLLKPQPLTTLNLEDSLLSARITGKEDFQAIRKPGKLDLASNISTFTPPPQI